MRYLNPCTFPLQEGEQEDEEDGDEIISAASTISPLLLESSLLLTHAQLKREFRHHSVVY